MLRLPARDGWYPDRQKGKSSAIQTPEQARARHGAGAFDRPLSEMTADELMALRDHYALRGWYIYNNSSWLAPTALLAGTGVTSLVIGSYVKAFMETLAKHNAEALIKLIRTRVRRRNKKMKC